MGRSAGGGAPGGGTRRDQPECTADRGDPSRPRSRRRPPRDSSGSPGGRLGGPRRRPCAVGPVGGSGCPTRTWRRSGRYPARPRAFARPHRMAAHQTQRLATASTARMVRGERATSVGAAEPVELQTVSYGGGVQATTLPVRRTAANRLPGCPRRVVRDCRVQTFPSCSMRRPSGAAWRSVQCSRKRSRGACGLRPVPARRAAAFTTRPRYVISCRTRFRIRGHRRISARRSYRSFHE